MHLFIRISTECEHEVFSQTEDLPVDDNKLHYWPTASLKLEGYTLGYNDLIVDLLLKTGHGNVLLKRTNIPFREIVHYPEDLGPKKQLRRSLSLRTQSSVYESLKAISTAHHSLHVDKILGFSYVAYLKDNVTPLGQLYIHSISMEWDLSAINPFQGHRITCMLNDQYLGRAQECITCETARCLAWIAVDTNDPWPMSPRGKDDFEMLRRESMELQWIRRSDPAGIGEKRLNQELETVADNDGFVNPVRRLPAHLELPLRVRIFNFKFNPPRSVETVLKRKDFGKRGMIERRLLPNLTVRVFFKLEKVECIKLHIAQYETTLDMDEMQRARTV